MISTLFEIGWAMFWLSLKMCLVYSRFQSLTSEFNFPNPDVTSSEMKVQFNLLYRTNWDLTNTFLNHCNISYGCCSFSIMCGQIKQQHSSLYVRHCGSSLLNSQPRGKVVECCDTRKNIVVFIHQWVSSCLLIRPLTRILKRDGNIYHSRIFISCSKLARNQETGSEVLSRYQDTYGFTLSGERWVRCTCRISLIIILSFVRLRTYRGKRKILFRHPLYNYAILDNNEIQSIF